MWHDRVCTWCHSHACQPGQLQRALVVTWWSVWMKATLSAEQHLSRTHLKITRAGSVSAFGPVWKRNLHVSGNWSLSKNLTSWFDLLPLHFKTVVPTFHSLYRPSLCCYHCEGWSVCSGSCQSWQLMHPDQANSPLNVSFTLLPPHLSAPSLWTGSDYTTVVCDRKNLCVCVCLGGRAAAKYACLSQWKHKSVFVNKARGVFIVLHVWDGQSG